MIVCQIQAGMFANVWW